MAGVARAERSTRGPQVEQRTARPRQPVCYAETALQRQGPASVGTEERPMAPKISASHEDTAL